MPRIVINSCNETATTQALHAVSKFIAENIVRAGDRNYQHEMNIWLSGDETFKVCEERMDVNKPTCDCIFSVERVDT